MYKVRFHHPYLSGLQHANLLKSFILSQISQFKSYKGININIIFVSDDFLLSLNKSHLQHDYYTDIITFDLSDTTDNLIAELYISVDRVKDNAKVLNFYYQNELRRVIFHGILHLLGQADKTDEESKLMRSKEEDWLTLYARHLL